MAKMRVPKCHHGYPMVVCLPDMSTIKYWAGPKNRTWTKKRLCF